MISILESSNDSTIKNETNQIKVAETAITVSNSEGWWTIPCGVSFLSRAVINDVATTIYVIKEEDHYIDLLGENAVFDIKVGILNVGKAAVVLACTLVNNNVETMYEMFFNYRGMDGVRVLDDLCELNNLTIMYINSKLETKTLFEIPNPFKNLLTKYRSEITSKHWKVDDFTLAKNVIYSNFTTGQALMDYLVAHSIV